MHHPRCVMFARNCLLGRPGHCARCPERGHRDVRVTRLALATSYAPDARHYGEPYGIRPDTEFVGGGVPEEVAEFLWPVSERGWIERDDRWAERAAYHVAVARVELIRELLREIHDLRRLVGPKGDTDG